MPAVRPEASAFRTVATMHSHEELLLEDLGTYLYRQQRQVYI